MSDLLANGLNFLVRHQNADGGWPYVAGNPSAPEPSCYALLALRHAPSANRANGVNWLTSRIHTSGAVVLEADTDPHWSTSLAVVTWTRLAVAAGARDRAVAWLLNWRGENAKRQEEVLLDATLVGWPWMSGSFSWVEPTCYAVLALRMAGRGDHPRVTEAGKLLLDRECPSGGWNYGNSSVMGTSLTGFLDTTALVMLALQDLPAAQPALERARSFVATERQRGLSVLTAALIALSASSSDDDAVRFLEQQQQPDGSWRHNIQLTALAVLALQAAKGGDHVFRIQSAP